MAALLSRVPVQRVLAMSTSAVVGDRGVAAALKDVTARVEAAHAKSGRSRAVRMRG